MASPAPPMEALSQWFLDSLSPNDGIRNAAVANLTSDTTTSVPGFPLSLLHLCSLPTSPLEVRLAAAVHLKNLLRRRWSQDDFPPSDRDAVKSNLLPLLLRSPPIIQSQLSESLVLIASHSPLHTSWPSLLPDLLSSLSAALSAPDYPTANSVLSVANSLFHKFRHSFKSNELLFELKHCLDCFAKPLLETFLSTSQRLQAGPADPKPLFDSQRLCCEIYLSLNALDLPEFFEDTMKQWMAEFRAYLLAQYPPQVEATGGPDALRGAICDILELYARQGEEAFQLFLGEFAGTVWGLLTSAATTRSRDQLAVSTIRFLTTVAASPHHTLFGSPEALSQIWGSVVFPNLRLRDDDEELFEMNFVDYIRRDIEGSDTDTLRRSACELLKSLTQHYRDQVAALVSRQVQTMLQLYSSNPGDNWKEKDAAVYLICALAQKPGSVSGGGTNLVDIESFFAAVVVPELQAQDVNAAPILKAGALKFLTVFREQIPKQAIIALLPTVIRFLGAESNVVHSYAANCIEKLLLVKDKVTTANGIVSTARYGALDIASFSRQILSGLFNALQMPESKENQYLMKCVMRVIGVVNLDAELANGCIVQLTATLADVCKNPNNPTFNHYMFEAISALINRAGDQDPGLLPFFETNLFPLLQKILVEDISEFWAYTFQIIAQLVRLSRLPLSENYMQMFQILLSPESWKRPANVPPLVRLLEAFLKKIPNEMNRDGKLVQVLGIFAKLISFSRTDESGFFVLNTVIENLGYDMIAPHIMNIWAALFTQLQSRSTPRFAKSLIIFMSLFLVKHGIGVLSDSVNAVQSPVPNLFLQIVEKFWIPNLQLISGATEIKLTSVASTRLICEYAGFLDDSAANMWGKMLESILSLLTKESEGGVVQEDDTPDFPENPGYSVSFERLQYAGRRDDDPLKAIGDPKQFLVVSLANLSATSPGKLVSRIEVHVSDNKKKALHEFCAMYNQIIV